MNRLTTTSRLAGAALLVALLLPPVALAQFGGIGTLTMPVTGEYSAVYIVSGRTLDALGKPMANGRVTVELDVPGASAAPLKAGTDCFGVFVTFFTIGHVDPRSVVKVTLHGENGAPDAVAQTPMDPFYRRTNLNLSSEGSAGPGCPDQTPLFEKRVSAAGRIVNRTEPYQVDSDTFHAKPTPGYVRLRWWPDESNPVCPPADDEGLCDPVPIDARGDFKYSWVYGSPVAATGRIEVLYGNSSWNLTVDPSYRVGYATIEATGLGPHYDKVETPGASLLAIAIAGIAAAVGRSLLPGKRAR